MQRLRIQLLLKGQLVLKEGPPHDAAAQEAQRARLYGLPNPCRCPLCNIPMSLRLYSLPQCLEHDTAELQMWMATHQERDVSLHVCWTAAARLHSIHLTA